MGDVQHLTQRDTFPRLLSLFVLLGIHHTAQQRRLLLGKQATSASSVAAHDVQTQVVVACSINCKSHSGSSRSCMCWRRTRPCTTNNAMCTGHNDEVAQGKGFSTRHVVVVAQPRRKKKTTPALAFSCPSRPQLVYPMCDGSSSASILAQRSHERSKIVVCKRWFARGRGSCN